MSRLKLKFATVNLHNLQLPGGETYPGTRPVGQSQYDAKLAFLSLMLKAVDADIYGFQELWARAALEELFERAGKGGEYQFVARDALGIGRPQVALAARADMIHLDERQGDDDAFWIEDFPQSVVFRKRRTIERIHVEIDNFSRPVLSAMIKPSWPDRTEPIKIMVAHLKSKRPINLDSDERDQPAVKANSGAIGAALASIRRTAEAAALRAMLNESMRDNQTPHVVLGDLNNGSLSVSTSIITGDPRYRLIETSRRVGGKRADLGLYSVERLQQLRSQRHTMYTHIFENKLETLDHILVSEEFYDHSLNRLWSFIETRVWNDHLSVAHDASQKGDPSMKVTDHGIVEATFVRNPLD